MPKTAGIILVGNEILSGKIEDANAVYLCRELRRLGMDVRKIAVIPDDVDVIATEVAAAHRAWDVVFTSAVSAPRTTTSPSRAWLGPSAWRWFAIPS